MTGKIYKVFYYLVTGPYMGLVLPFVWTVSYLLLTIKPLEANSEISSNGRDKQIFKGKIQKYTVYFMAFLLVLGVVLIVLSEGMGFMRIAGIYLATVSVVKLWEVNVKTYTEKNPDILEK